MLVFLFLLVIKFSRTLVRKLEVESVTRDLGVVFWHGTKGIGLIITRQSIGLTVKKRKKYNNQPSNQLRNPIVIKPVISIRYSKFIVTEKWVLGSLLQRGKGYFTKSSIF